MRLSKCATAHLTGCAIMQPRYMIFVDVKRLAQKIAFRRPSERNTSGATARTENHIRATGVAAVPSVLRLD